MPRNGISKQKVIQAIKEMLLNDHVPTTLKLREKLKSGSASTIQKYLQEWRKNCFKNANFDLSENTDINPYNNELLEKYRILEQNLNKQINKNEHYAQELINAEKNNVAFKEENHQLQIANQELKLKLTAADSANNTLLQTTQKIQNQLDLNTNTIIQEMQQTIDDLRLELKTLNETYINALRETSTQGHEALMQEKVNSINLQTKIDNLTKELLDSKKKAYEASMTAQVQNRSLSRQNEQLQKIIEENGLDKLLSAAEGSSLVFTNGAAVDGK